MEYKFTEKDKVKIIEFLNMISEKAKFEMNTIEIIEYYKLLSFMQQTLLPKVEANILEIRQVIPATEEKNDN